MRLIDADALIEKCGDWYVKEGTESGFIGTLENLLVTRPTITSEPHWIPVTERLPEEENMYQRPTKRYLCQRESGGVRQFFVGARLCDPNGLLKEWWDWYGTKIRDSEVVAYMPLPEPFKGVTDGRD